MPITHPTTTTSNNILEYTIVAANALRDVAAATQIPFVGTVCALASTIIPTVQNTKFQKDRCLRIIEDIHHLLWALVNLSAQSEDMPSPVMLNQIAKCALTLQKIDSCLRVQQDLGTIKRLFKQSELVTQLETCEAEFKVAVEDFTITQGVGLASALVEFDIDT
ncbi:hypothetical protein B0H14DRAFT_3878979, partial [Mycena olivaceomarginata]